MPICEVDKAGAPTSAKAAGDCMTESLVVTLGTAANFGTWIGTLIIGPVSEHWFRRQFKLLLLLLFGTQVLLFGGLTLSLPLAGMPPLVPGASAARLVLLVGLASVAIGATSPMFVELGAS